MHSLLHDILRFLILFLEELFLIFNQMLSIRAFGRRDIGFRDINIGSTHTFYTHNIKNPSERLNNLPIFGSKYIRTCVFAYM